MSAKISLALVVLILFCVKLTAQNDTTIISEDLKIVKLGDHSFVHISFFESQEWGRFPSNGLIFINNGKAILIDTPMRESLTIDLVDWIQNNFDAKITGFIPNHWHDDCTAGLSYLHSIGVKSYAHELTVNILGLKKLPVPQHSFSDSLVLTLDDKKIIFHYFGPGHTIDNTVAWIPTDEVLFGGCLVKELNAKGLGNISDASLQDWPVTLKKVWNNYKEAKFVIPGHGSVGNSSLLLHSIELLENRD